MGNQPEPLTSGDLWFQSKEFGLTSSFTGGDGMGGLPGCDGEMTTGGVTGLRMGKSFGSGPGFLLCGRGDPIAASACRLVPLDGELPPPPTKSISASSTIIRYTNTESIQLSIIVHKVVVPETLQCLPCQS